MDKASKTAIVMRHEPTGLYFSKTAGLTENLFSAMPFADENNARQIVYEGHLRPKDPDNYKPYPLVTTKEVVEHEQVGAISEDRQGHGASRTVG